MAITTLLSGEFNQGTSRAKQAASRGPVFITERGRPVHVLLTIEDYQKLTGTHVSIVDQLVMPGVETSSSIRLVSAAAWDAPVELVNRQFRGKFGRNSWFEVCADDSAPCPTEPAVLGFSTA